MKIRTQMIAGIVVFAVLIIIIAGLYITTDLQVEELNRQEQIANKIALQIGELGYLSNDYILFREPQQAERWETKFSAISGLVASLSVESPEQQAIAGNLAANLRSTHAVFDDIRSGGAQEGTTGTGFIQLSWSMMAVQNQGMIFDAGRLADLLGDEADQLRQARTLFILALAGAFVALLFTSYFLFFRRTLNSMADLQEGAQVIGSGDLSHEIPEKGDDEITELTRSFNRMTANLKTVIASKQELEWEMAEREKAEKARRKIEERLQLAQKASGTGIWDWNVVSGDLSWDPQLFTIFGLDPEKDRHDFATWDRILHPEDLAVAHDRINAALKEHSDLDSQYRIIRPDGEVRWIQALGQGMYDQKGEAVRMTGTCVDITGRKMVEIALNQSEERYRSLFETMSEGFSINEIIFDSGGNPCDIRYLLVNPAFERHTGLKAGDVIGRTALEMFPDAEPVWIERYGKVARTGEPVHFEERFGPLRKWFAVSVYRTGQDRIAMVLSDITEQKNAQEEIAWLASFPEQNPNPVIEVEVSGHPTYINPAARRLFPDMEKGGVSHTDLEGIQEIIAGMQEKREPLVYREVRSGSSYFDLTLTYIEDARRVRIYGRDITRRKEAEVALRESRGRLNEALDLLDAVTKGADVIIAAQDPDFRYTYFNRAYADEIRRLAGRDIAVGMSMFEVFNGLPDELENSVKEWGRVLGGESVNRRVDFGEPGPSRRTYHVLHTPVRDFTGSVVGAGEVAYDITEQARVEDELRRTRTYLENLITYANAPIIVWDPDFRITRFNQAFEYLTGWKAKDVIGSDISLLFPEETRVESLEKILRTFAGERFETTEIPILHRDGSVKTVLWNSATIFDEEGGVISTIAQGQDITERKAAEKALKEYAISLKRSNEDLERFAYVSSHDLQEPLRNVVIFTQLLERKYGGQMGEEADEYLRFVVDAGKKMQSLISDLLAYSRVTTRESRIVRTESETVLKETLAALKPRIDRCNVRITNDPLPPVMADATQLGPVFQNLIGNAIKFRQPDVMPEIHVSGHYMDGMVRFSVRDNGIGIDPEYFDRIFVIFQRLHRYEEYEGTGIGLALCKRIIERHGGRIWVESGVGKGSTFFFTLPAAD